MTLSIAARDPDSGCLGVAVATAQVAPGTRVLHALAGVGVLAAQAESDLAFGERILALLAGGSTAAQAVQGLLAEIDPTRVQFGVAAADGSLCAYTGPGCTVDAGHVQGKTAVAQANMMASPRVWGAMVDAFETATLDFPARLVAALAAGEEAGGDIRGVQGAALLVVSPRRGDAFTAWYWDENLDLRVDDDDDPVGKLGDLLNANTAQNLAAAAAHGVTGFPPEVLLALRKAATLAPADANTAFNCATACLSNDLPQEAAGYLRAAARRNKNLAVRIARLEQPLREQVVNLLRDFP